MLQRSVSDSRIRYPGIGSLSDNNLPVKEPSARIALRMGKPGGIERNPPVAIASFAVTIDAIVAVDLFACLMDSRLVVIFSLSVRQWNCHADSVTDVAHGVNKRGVTKLLAQSPNKHFY